METAAKINLFFTDSSSIEKLTDLPKGYSELYQHLFKGLIKSVHKKQFLLRLGNKLVAMAEQAHAFRQMDALEEVGQILVSLPLPKQYQAIGHYYQALCVHRFGRGEIDRAACLLESAVTDAPALYKLRAFQSLAGNYFHRGDYKSALSLYNEASRENIRSGFYDSYTIIGTQRMVAVIKSIDGNHRDAAALMENLFPLTHALRSAHPHLYYDYLNSYAVELGEVGRLEEAQNVSLSALTSSYAAAYPEWRETYNDIALKRRSASRSAVAIKQSPIAIDNLVRLPAPQQHENYRTSMSNSVRRPAQVFNLGEWKKKMNKVADDTPHEKLTGKQIKQMSREEKLCAIARLIYADDAQEEMLDRFLEIANQIRSTRTDRS